MIKFFKNNSNSIVICMNNTGYLVSFCKSSSRRRLIKMIPIPKDRKYMTASSMEEAIRYVKSLK